jgi:hypothetical protein
MTFKASFAAPTTVILASLLFLAPDRVSAQQDSTAARLLIPSMPVQRFDAPPPPPPERRSYIFPGVTVSSPTAMGAEGGTLYLGVGYQNRIRYRSREDGAVVAGFGLGNAHKYVALEMTATSYSTVRSGWLDRMGFGAQVHRYLDPRRRDRRMHMTKARPGRHRRHAIIQWIFTA